MKAAPRISDAEWDVMEVLWAESPLRAAEVSKALAAKRGWKDNTVRTLLARLVQKGALAYEADGNRYLYRPAVSRALCAQAESETFMNRVFSGSVQPLLLHFVSKSKLSKAEILELRRLLEKK